MLKKHLMCAAALVVVGGATEVRSQSATAVTGITLVDVVSATTRPNITILVRGRTIADVFPTGSKSLPQDARIIDGRGRFVIPGLIDSHVHNATIEERPQQMREALLRNALMGGVTAVRDMGGRSSDTRAFAARAAHDTVPWPRIFYSAIIAGPGGWFEGRRGAYMAEGGAAGEAPLVRRVAAPGDVAPAISSARAAGATGIKLYNNIDPRLLPAITAEARRQNLRVWGHLAVDPGKPSDLVRSGVDALSHADQFLAEVLPWPDASLPRDSARAIRHRAFLDTPLDAEPLTRLLNEMKSRDVALDATLYIMTPQPDSMGRINERAAALYTFATGMVRRANELGVAIVAGTDDMARNSPNIHAEMQLLVERSGLTPMQALQAATINGARVLGMEKSLGSIETGKLADLVILQANPLADLANTLTVETVVKGGVVYKRESPMRTPQNARAPRT
jgi:imidazolonepropionase-like amidohydrolase